MLKGLLKGKSNKIQPVDAESAKSIPASSAQAAVRNAAALIEHDDAKDAVPPLPSAPKTHYRTLSGFRNVAGKQCFYSYTVRAELVATMQIQDTPRKTVTFIEPSKEQKDVLVRLPNQNVTPYQVEYEGQTFNLAHPDVKPMEIPKEESVSTKEVEPVAQPAKSWWPSCCSC